jgi:hypothetical protein
MINIHLVLRMQSLLYVESIDNIKQPSCMVCATLRSTSPTSHLADLLNLVVIFETCDTYVCECWQYLCL